MRGSYYLKIWNRHISYDLNIERNITIIKGDSGTGKTALLNLLRLYLNKGKSSGVRISTNIKSFDILEGRTDWRLVLENKHDCIYFVDEDVDYVLDNMKLLGCKGTTGTQASFKELFDGIQKRFRK